MKREKPIVGQRVYLSEIGYNNRPEPGGLQALEVVRVGRKYFYTGPAKDSNKRCRELAWHIDTWGENTDYISRCTLYSSVQEFDDVQEGRALQHALRESFGRWSRQDQSTLDQLRRIKAIIDEGEDERR
ncbi:MAG: hypothetical protein JRC86_07250 [Deltaproteobacteria bacterium]|nr:hypothetical protein [Deltaproteobacteria bacterium]